MALTLRIEQLVHWLYTGSNDHGTPEHRDFLDLADALASGTGLDQCDLLFADRRTLAATSENLDLAGGLTDVFGNALTFARVKLLWIHNRQTEAGRVLTIGGHATAAFALFSDATDKYPLGPDGRLLIEEPSAAGKVVTGTTADLLKIDAGASNIVYDILIAGASA